MKISTRTVDLQGKIQISEYWGHEKTKLPEVMGRIKIKSYCPGTICQTCILAMPVTIKVGLTKAGNQAKPVTYSEKSYPYQFRADAPIYGHWPQYKADNNAAEIVVCTQMPGCCCCLNDMGNKILFCIKWQWVNQAFHVAFLQGFSTATFREKQTLMLNLFTVTNNTMHSIFGWAMCMTFSLGLTRYSHSSVHRFTGCVWRKSY